MNMIDIKPLQGLAPVRSVAAIPTWLQTNTGDYLYDCPTLARETAQALLKHGLVEFAWIQSADNAYEAKKPLTHKVENAVNTAWYPSILPSGIDVIRPSRNRETFKRLRFDVRKTDAQCLVVCTHTGITGTLNMPSIPGISLDYTHPLAYTTNAVTVLQAAFKHSKDSKDIKPLELERQVLSGLIITLLHAKHKLPTEQRNTTAIERNLMLQSAGPETLTWLLYQIHRNWDNHNVWDKLPNLSIDWETHARNPGEMASAINNYTRLIRNANNPAELTNPELQAQYVLMAKKDKGAKKKTSITVANIQRFQSSVLTEQRKVAEGIFESIRSAMPSSLARAVTTCFKGFTVYSNEHKHALAQQIRIAFVGSSLHDAAAKRLADIFEAADNSKLLEGLDGFLVDSPSLGTPKSLAESYAERLARKNKTTTQSQE